MSEKGGTRNVIRRLLVGLVVFLVCVPFSSFSLPKAQAAGSDPNIDYLTTEKYAGIDGSTINAACTPGMDMQAAFTKLKADHNAVVIPDAATYSNIYGC